MYSPVQVKKTTIYLNFTAEKQDSEGKQPLRTSVLNTGCPPTFRTHRRAGADVNENGYSLKVSAISGFLVFLMILESVTASPSLFLPGSASILSFCLAGREASKGLLRSTGLHLTACLGSLVFSSWPVATVEPLGFTHSLAKTNKQKKW